MSTEISVSEQFSNTCSVTARSSEAFEAALRAVNDISPSLSERAAQLDAPHHETFADMKSAGLARFVIPAALGGGGATLAEASSVIRALATADGSAALVLTMHYIHSTRLLTSVDPSPSVQRLGRRLADSGGLLNFAASEGRSGAPSRGGRPLTTATRVADGWELNGHKRYVTGSIGLDVILVTATVADTAGRDEPAVHTFAVDADTPGLRIDETWDTIGLRGTASNDVILDHVRLPAEAVVTAYDPNTHDEARTAFSHWWSLLMASIYYGIGTAARCHALDFAAGDRNDGQPGPRSDQPRTRRWASEIELALLQAESLIDYTIGRVSTGVWGDPALGPAVKHLVHEHVTRAVDNAGRLVGGASIWNDSPLSKLYRDLRVARFNPPSDDIVLEQVADLLFANDGRTLLANRRKAI